MSQTLDANLFRRRPGLRGWLLMAPLFLWLAAFVIAPNLIMLVYSFSHYDGPATVRLGFTFDNYVRIFDPALLPILRDAVIFGVIGAVVGLCLGIPIAEGRQTGDRSEFVVHFALVGFLIGFCLLIHKGVFDLPLGTGSDAKILLRSIEYAALTTVLCLAIGYPVAYFIGRAPEAWRNRLLLLVMIPFWTSFLIRTYAWITILSEQGLLNGLLRYTGLIASNGLFQQPVRMLYTPMAVVIGLVYSYVPFMILPIYGSVEKLDNSLLEAALDLGAGPVRAFGQVIVPLTRPGIVAGIMLVFIPAIGMFAIVELMGGGSSLTIGTKIQSQFTGQSGDWPYGSALGMTILFLFALSYAIFARKGPILAG